MQKFVYVKGFVFHTCAGFFSVTPWDDGSHCGWRKGWIYVTVLCKVKASSPGSYVSVTHQLSSAAEMFWICCLCFEQMVPLSPHQLPCMPDVSRIRHICCVLELHVCVLMICLGLLDIQKSQTSTQLGAQLPGRGDGGKTSSCFALLVRAAQNPTEVGHPWRWDQLVCRRSFFNMSFTGICKDSFTDLCVIDSFGELLHF